MAELCKDLNISKIVLRLIKQISKNNKLLININSMMVNFYNFRLIRKLDFEYAKNIPIIAMTADAFSENIAECKKAGMNGHIAKPIDLNIVLSEIKKIKEKL